MFNRGFFKVEEIGTTGSERNIFFKGKRRSIFEEEELVRCMFVSPSEYTRGIISLTEGKLDEEAEFTRNVFKLAENGIKEIRISRKELRSGGAYTTSDLKFLDNNSISKVLPQDGLKCLLACKGIGNGNVYCHEDLHEPPENTYDEKRRDEAIKRHEFMKDYFVFFKKIEDIEIEDKKLHVDVNEDEYEKLHLDRVLGHYLIMGAAYPRTIVYRKGSKNYGMQFPMNGATFGNFLKGRVSDPSRVVYSESLLNPGFLLESMSIIDRVMKKANIKTKSIYVDGTVKHHVHARFGNLLLCDPGSAKIILEKNGQKIATPAPWDKAISLSYLNSKDIWIRNLTGSYTA